MARKHSLGKLFNLRAEDRDRNRRAARRSRFRSTLMVEQLESRRLLAADNPLLLGSLNGTTGFRIDGIDASDYSGRSVSSAGDVNGDGFDDLIIGADFGDPAGNSAAGESYVVFGKSGAFSSSIALSSLDGTNGFRIDGIDANDYSGRSVSGAGDVNGDGFDDLIIGALNGDPGVNANAGESYVLFGKASGFASSIALSTLNGTNGFRIDGIDANDLSGRSVSSAGDVNGDGYDDLIIGANNGDPGGNSNAGESYVVFGQSGGFASSILLSSLNGTNGFRIDGIDAGDYSGRSVSKAGDMNGDGFGDLLVGAFGADQGANLSVGESYVVFGKASFSATLALSSLDGTNGFRIDGIDASDFSSFPLSSAGDVNGDGFDDIIIGAYGADQGPNLTVGESYVVFGKSSGFTSSLALSSLNGINGFRIDGIDANDFSGYSVSGAGDINGDGFDDLIIGALGGDPSGNSGAGESYVLFGKSGGFSSSISLSTLNGTNGFRLDGMDAGDQSGRVVSRAGDVNGDGFDDLIIGALNGDPGAISNAGESYVVFGGNFTGGVETQVGGNSSDTLTANRGASFIDVLVGGRGNDTLISDGGSDVLLGGQGDDTLAIPDLIFSGTRRIVGGSGVDTLRLDGGAQSLDMSAVLDNRILGIEVIDITGSGNNTLTVTARDVLNFSDSSNTLTVRGNVGDRVKIGDWAEGANQTIGPDTFRVFTQGAATLRVIVGVSIQTTIIDLSNMGATGTTIFGVDANDQSGRSVSNAGDVNGDGFDDLVIGAARADASGNAKSNAGDSYVIFGAASLPATIDLTNLGSAGITIFGAEAIDYSGVSVSSAGDVNGDGFDDLIIGAYNADALGNAKSYAGDSYVIFGSASLPATIDLTNLGSAGVTIFGAEAGDRSGFSVSTAGDVNGDGFDDLVIGAYGADASGNAKSFAGDSYVIFGAALLPTTIDLAILGSAGVTIFGAESGDQSGFSVSSAGDVNGDGFDDLIIGAVNADASGNAKFGAGDSYVIFGATSLPASIDLASLGSAGITIFGADSSDNSGRSVSSAGDVNGDGFDDLVIGATLADASGNTKSYAGDSYVIFGAALLPTTIDLANLGPAGITIYGADAGDQSGRSVNRAGDVNGDGFEDLIIGAVYADASGNTKFSAGDSYVLFGAASLPVTIDLANLGSAGIAIFGADGGDQSGRAVSYAGDVNGDGFDDLVIGALLADALGNAKSYAGDSYVIFGSNDLTNSIAAGNLGTSTANTINGTPSAEIINGADGIDTLVGGGGADILLGGRGNDVLAVSDLSFKRIVGGNGVDTLRLDGSGLTLDLTTVRDNRLTGIEQIDITGSGNNTLMLNQRDVLNLSDSSNTLTIRGNVGDRVKIGGWAEGANQTIGPDTFRVFTQGAATLRVIAGVSIQTTIIDLSNLGATGTTILGADSSDISGISVSNAGDINGDGFDDLVIGADRADGSGNAKFGAGDSYVIFGAASLPATIDLANLGSSGIAIFGAGVNDYSGVSVSSAGDVNGDGFDDLVIGAYRADALGNAKNYAGDSYVIFGSASLPATIDLANLGSSGITIFGAEAGDTSGQSVSSAGDVNGDGFDDLVIGAYSADASGNAKSFAGDSYVIFGAASLPTTIDLAFIGSAGITIFGADTGDKSGFSVSSAGDVNGDGFDDLIIGAYGADASGDAKSFAGDSYVLFGMASLPATIDLAFLGSAGITIFGADTGDGSGRSVNSAGDVNGDGFDDLVIGAFAADASGDAKSFAGDSYVIFGAASLPATIDLANLGSAGITIFGADAGDQSGKSVSSAGDVNGDGFDDLIIGAVYGAASGNAKPLAGDNYLIFGAASLPATIDLANLGSAGITIFGAEANDRSGQSVSGAGDVNGDGFDDLVIGAVGADALGNAKSYAGDTYVIYGSNDLTNSIAAGNLGAIAANTINGTPSAEIISGADGIDTLVGGGGADVLLGGRGDDVLAISDLSFKRIVGGNGVDTIQLDGSGLTLDLTTIADNRIVDIEVVDLTGSGDNALVLDAQEVLNISSHSNTLIVRRDVGDVVTKGTGWTQIADESMGGDTFEVYRQGAATLKIHRLAHTFNITSGNGLDVMSLRRNGSDIELYDDGVLLDSIRTPLLESLTIRSASGEANRLDVDYATGGFFDIPGGVAFIGSSSTDDLRIIGNGSIVATFVSAGPLMTNGSVLISEGGPATSIAFTGIEPLSLSGLLSMDVSGVLGVGSQTLTIDAATFTELGSATTLTGGTINAPAGLHLGPAKVLQARGTINASIASDVGSTITLTGNLTMGNVAAFDGINLAGRLNIGANVLTLLDGHKAVLGSQTTIGTAVANGTLNSTFGIELPDTRTFVGRGTINTTSGQFENQGFVQGNAPGLTFDHLVTGRGDFGGTISFLGGYSPGNSPAMISAENITFGPLNTNHVEIGGLVAGSEFDQVNAGGTATLNGTLQVTFLNLGNGYVPAAGHSFDIINAGSISGVFTTTVFPSLPVGLQWNIVYQANRVLLTITQIPATIAGRRVFFNNAVGTNLSSAGAANSAIASDKSPLLPGNASTFANYTNYARGLNGIIVDVNNLPAATTNSQILASLQFAQWNGISAAGFAALPVAAVPTATILSGSGTGGSARVKITFPDNTLQNTWLRVTVLANANTALAANDVFYFGNVIGDLDFGNTATRLRVNGQDAALILANQSPGANSAGVTNRFDLDRNGRVNGQDYALLLANQQAAGIVAPITAPSARSSSAIRSSSISTELGAVPFELQTSLKKERHLDSEWDSVDAYFAELWKSF